MTDIYLGLAIVLLLGAGLFVAGLRLGRAVSRRLAALAVLPALALVGVHSFVLLDDPRLAWALPVSNLVIVGNVSPLAVGFLAGLAWRHIPPPAWRRLLLVGPLLLVCLYFAFGRYLGPTPKCFDNAADGVSIPTTFVTANAANAATLLAAHGIEAAESEVARLSLTRYWGTSTHGLYRALKLKTAGTPYDVEVVSWSYEELRQKPPGPVLVLLRPEADITRDGRYERRWGWIRAVPNAVVLFDFLDDERVQMADPYGGRQVWRADHLRTMWRGEAMRLVKRQ